MPIYIDLDDQQLRQLAKDIIGDVRRVIAGFEDRVQKMENIILDSKEQKLFKKYIAQLLSGEYENGKHNTINN